VNRKVKRLALRSALSLKVKEQRLNVVQSFDIDKPSTKAMKGFFTALSVVKPLVLMQGKDCNVSQSARNIPGAKVVNIDSINVYDILNAGNVILTPEAIKKIEEVYAL
jgi:large subunit ribosomal protein L4